MSSEVVRLKFDAHVGSTLSNLKALSDGGIVDALPLLVDSLVEGAKAFLKSIDDPPAEKPAKKAAAKEDKE